MSTLTNRVDPTGEANAPLTGGPHAIEEHERSPLHMCSAENCGKLAKGLKTCSGCKIVYYCSKRCQKYDWLHGHKEVCEVAKINEATEGPLMRDLRQFNARFEITFRMAFMWALDLRNFPSKIGTHGLVVYLNPRPRGQPGARFIIHQIEIIKLESLRRTLLAHHPNFGPALRLHEKKRLELQSQTDGEDDHGMMLTIAHNTGPGKIDSDEIVEMRLRPVSLHLPMARNNEMFADTSQRWLVWLEMQVNQDKPARYAVPGEVPSIS